MDIGRVGTGSFDRAPDPLRETGNVASHRSSGSTANLRSSGDVAVFLRDLADPSMAEVLQAIERGRLEQELSTLEQLIRTAVDAADDHRFPAALEAITRLVTLNPEIAPELISREASLSSLRPEIRNLMQRLAGEAKSDAQRTLAAAADALQVPGSRSISTGGADPWEILKVAARYLDTGQHINHVRAAELGKVVLDACSKRASPDRSVLSRPASRRSMAWRKVPLVILLAVWFMAGLISLLIGSGNVDFEVADAAIWALGVLALWYFSSQ